MTSRRARERQNARPWEQGEQPEPEDRQHAGDFPEYDDEEEQEQADAIAVQEAWEAAGGNPGIKATKVDLLAALRMLDEVCDEASQEPKRINEVDLGPLKAELTDPEKAKAFLRNAGILNERDELTEAFGGKAEPAAQDHIPDTGKMVETAAPVGEREAFEAWLGITPCGAAHDFGWAAWQARAAQAAKAVPNPWRDAVIEQLESWHIYVPAIHENSPRLAIKALVNIETQTALDPKVSSQAAALAAGAVPDERDKVVDWAECKRISEVPDVDEALRLFADGETSEDQAVAIVQALLGARAEGGAA